MEKFASSPRSSLLSQPSPRQQESLEKVFFRLKDLNEIQDESRN